MIMKVPATVLDLTSVVGAPSPKYLLQVAANSEDPCSLAYGQPTGISGEPLTDAIDAAEDNDGSSGRSVNPVKKHPHQG
jgi:hypothetical protein